MQTPTTRYLCPLDCGWHHDSRDLPDLAGLAGDTIEDIIWAGIQRQTQADEDTIRQHLEAHPLIEWVQEVARLQRELNAAVAVRPACSDEEGFCDAHGFHRHPTAEPLRTPATGGDQPRCPHCQMPHDLAGWPAEVCRRMRENGRVDDPAGESMEMSADIEEHGQ